MTEEAAAAKQLFDKRALERSGAGAVPRRQRRDGRRRGQQAARAVLPRDLALSPEVLPGELRDLQRDRRQAEPPEVQRDAALAREARDAAARARRHHRARRQVQRRAGRRASTTRSSATCTGSSTTCSAATSTATASTRRRSACSRRSTGAASTTCKAQFFTGICYVQLRKSVPAVEVVPAHRQGARRRRRGRRGRGPHARPRVPLDGAHLLLGVDQARRRDQRADHRRAPSSRAAVKYWNTVDVASEYWLDALFEESWAYFMAGDYPHALGNIHTIQAPYFPNSFYPGGRHPQGGHLLRQLQLRRRRRSSSRASTRSTCRSTTSSRRSSSASRARTRKSRSSSS